jgi:hypothetical protein
MAWASSGGALAPGTLHAAADPLKVAPPMVGSAWEALSRLGIDS